MMVFGSVARKGGTGKTTMAVNLAEACAQRDLKTLVIDTDGQGTATSRMGLDRGPGLYSLFLAQDRRELADVILPVSTTFTSSKAAPMGVIPADDSIMDVEESTETLAFIRSLLRQLEPYFDVVWFDTSPGLNRIHAALDLFCDYLLLPTTLAQEGIETLALTIGYLEQVEQRARAMGLAPAKVLGIVPNLMDTRHKLHRENVGYIKGKYGDRFRVFAPMRDLAVWQDCAAAKTSIFNYAPKDYYKRREARVAVSEFEGVVQAMLAAMVVPA